MPDSFHLCPPRLPSRFVSVLLLLMAGCDQLAMAVSDGYVLVQKSGLRGRVRIYACPNAIKLVDGNTGCNLIMKAPEWKVSYFNDRAKVIYQTDAQHFQGRSSLAFSDVFGARFLGVVPVPGKAAASTVAGLNVRVLRMTSATPKAPKGPRPPGAERIYVRQATYYGTDDLSLPPSVSLVLQRYYKIPSVAGFPVKVSIVNDAGHDKKELNTESCTRSPMPPSTFDIPSGYKRVNSEPAVVANDQKDLLNDMVEGFGSPKTK